MQDSLFSHRSTGSGPASPDTPRPAPQPAIEPVQGVSRVVNYIKRIIEGNKILPFIRVRGEVTELRERNGIVYFALKENLDILRCMVWPNAVAKLPPFKNGDEIICGGDFTAFTRQSYYELVVKSVELTGVGALYAQFEALKEQFRKEGLFEQSRKRPLPAFPRRIAVISAPDGKGVEDFFTTIAREAPFIDVVRVPTRVQGDGAEIDIAEAIRKASKLDVDVIVLTRGGGSYEDLFPFNREPVVRAIVAAKHPVISAIGHTGDVHVSDFVADYTCETPSNAAHYFGGIGKNYLSRVQHARMSLEHLLQSLLVTHIQTLDSAASRVTRSIRDLVRERERSLHLLERRLNLQTPQQRLAQRGQRITALRTRLELLARNATSQSGVRVAQLERRLSQLRAHALSPAQQRFELLRTRLAGADPQLPLARGYAIVTLDGHAVRDAGAVPDGALIEAQLQRGKLTARVERRDLDG